MKFTIVQNYVTMEIWSTMENYDDIPKSLELWFTIEKPRVPYQKLGFRKISWYYIENYEHFI